MHLPPEEKQTAYKEKLKSHPNQLYVKHFLKCKEYDRIMKLGEIQHEYKFIQEKIFEGIWPFSKLQAPYNVLLLSLIYFVAGFGLYIVFSVPIFFFIAGTCAGIGISVWTYGILGYATKLRNTKFERMTKVKNKFLVTFMEELFHDRSLFFGVMAFVASLTYFWSSEIIGIENILQNLSHQSGVEVLDPFFLFYIFTIAFDVCYRYGLSAYISLALLRRNLQAARLLRDPELRKQFTSRDFLELERVDWFHVASFSGGIFLIPLALLDPILFIGLVLYLSVSLLAATINILQLRILQSKAMPKAVIDLLSSCRVAYIGTSSARSIPHITPTLFAFDGRRVFFVTSIKSQKIKNLHRYKNVAVYIDYVSPKHPSKNRSILIQGRAYVYGHNMITAIFFVMVYGLRMLYVKTLYHRKYPEFVRYYQFKANSLPGPWRLRPILSRTIVEIVPYHFIYWKGTKFTKTTVI
ncbi:MAG: pyridoxamine 5'-phosphate oxidase family protein [Promethearchaeota archaeon]